MFILAHTLYIYMPIYPWNVMMRGVFWLFWLHWLRFPRQHAVAMVYTALTLLATLVTAQGTDPGVQRLYLDQGEATL